MSAFYDQASLVVVPSGYKSGKIYAQKPLTTDGQLTFTRASTATRVNASGLIETVASGVPRLDYLGSSCPKLQLEPQRSNLTLHSQQLDNANYTLLNLTIAANNTTSPDGTQSAEKLTETTANGEHLLYAIQSIGLGTYTMSAFFKAGGGTVFPVLRFNGNTTNAYAGCVFNTTTGQVVNTFSNTYTGTTTKVDNMGNGWYRVSLTTTTNETTFGVRIASSNTATPTIGDFGSISYAGNTNNFFYAWGAQFEAGAYATSYIPTTTAAVTRVEDAAYKTGISSLIGQTEGTIFFEVDKTTRLDNDYRVQISDGTTNNWLFVSVEVGNSIRLYCNVGGVNQFSVYGSVVTSGRHKVAMAYKANDFKVYVDGVAWITQTSGNVPACSKLNLGSPAPTVDAANTDSKTAQALLFKTRLTNAQLAELTTL
jgi:hypothetical protein